MSINTSRQKKDPLSPAGFRLDVGYLLLGTLAINILSLALPVMTLQVYDRILPNPGSGTLPVLMAGVCLAIFLEAMLRLIRAYMIGWSGAAYEHRMSCAAIQHILGSDLSKLGPFGTGEHLSRIDSIGKLKDFYSGHALVTLSELVFVPMFLGLMIYIAGALAVVPAVILMAFTVVSLSFGQKLRASLKMRDEADDQRYNFLISGLEGIHTVKSFALENRMARQYEELESVSTLANYRLTESTSATFNAGAIFSNLMVIGVITVGAVFALQGMLTTGALIATILLSGRMMQPVQRALALWAKYQDYTLARERVEDIFDTPRHTPLVNDNRVQRRGSLEIDNLSFRYGPQSPWIVKDAHLSVSQRDVVLLTGGHGAGKTALLELIAGIYPPSRGEIKIDGQNVMRYAPDELIRHVGYIEQDGTIFQGTIRDNMTCFGQIMDKDVQDIAQMLNVDKDVAKLPSGFDTRLDGHGMQAIPPGLRQRIAMVRTLAQKPRLILFDNADRALDRKGYHLVYDLLARLRGKAGLVIVSDDRNIRGLANRFVALDNGQLVEIDQQQSTGNIHSYRELKI